MFGKRPDGIRIDCVDPVMKITPYVMPMRCDAQVFMKAKAEMDVLSRYVRRQKMEKNESISYMQIVVAAYVRAISRNPAVNRFIMNKQLFARNNCSVAFTILKDPADIEKGEAVVKIRFDLSDTLYDVRDRMVAGVEANRILSEPGFLEKLLNGLFAVPGLATVAVSVVRVLDRYGIAPAILMDELPFYVGMYVTNTGSIGLGDVNHHLYNWGNVGLFLGIGLPEKQLVMKDGNIQAKRYLSFGITADERVCSGAHYADFFRDMKHYLAHPELLETEPTEVRFDQGCEYHEPKQGASKGT